MDQSTDQSKESIQFAASDVEIQGCFAVMVQLRPHLIADTFVDRVRRQMQQGYQLAFIAAGDRSPDHQFDDGYSDGYSDSSVVAVAGFRISENLAWGKFLYVDDLITDAKTRSRGYGQQLLQWLVEYGRSHHCEQFHLDSGVQRFEAHRFYFRQRLSITSYHFAMLLK